MQPRWSSRLFPWDLQNPFGLPPSRFSFEFCTGFGVACERIQRYYCLLAIQQCSEGSKDTPLRERIARTYQALPWRCCCCCWTSVGPSQSFSMDSCVLMRISKLRWCQLPSKRTRRAGQRFRFSLARSCVCVTRRTYCMSYVYVRDKNVDNNILLAASCMHLVVCFLTV